MECRICRTKTHRFADATILSRYRIDYYLCENCGFLQTEQPYWLSEAYNDSINICDTGIMQRNIDFSQKTAVLLYTLFDRNCKCLDYAGGYGIFCRLMRDMGFDFFWHDPYTKNLLARGFECNANQKIDFITSFESFEHFQYPLIEIEKLMAMSDSILFSTLLYPSPLPPPAGWWYYGLDHGQHIGFYSENTLRFIADYFDVNFFSDGNHLHLFVKKNLKIKNLNLLLKYRFLIIGKNKINNLMKKSDKLYPYLHRKFKRNRVLKDMFFLTREDNNLRRKN